MKNILFIFCAFSAAVLSAGSFTLDKSGNILFNNRPLTVSEYFVLPDGTKNIEVTAPEITQHKVNGMQVINRLGKNPDFPCRRETALAADGSKVELGFQARINAFTVPAEHPGKDSSYNLVFDLSEFEGGKYYLITGRSQKTEVSEGIFQHSKFPSGGARFLALQKGEKRLVLDFNVEGVTSYSSASPGGIPGIWHIMVRNNKLIASIGFNCRYQGGTFQAKVVVYEGSGADYDKYHAWRKYSYQSDFGVERSYSFAAAKTGKNYLNINDKAFNAKDKAGWVKLNKAEKLSIAPTGALYAALKGSGKAVFKVDDLRSGVYYVTLRSAAGKTASGKFSAAVNGKTLVRDYTIPAGEVLTATLPMWIENGTAELELSGDWQISTLMFQLLQTSFEDIKFRRGYWVSDDFEPCVLLKNDYYRNPPVMRADVYTEKLAPYRFQAPANYKLNMKKEVLLPESTAKNSWRYNELYISSGANKSTFTDFVTDELKEKELAHIAKSNGGIVLISGMLSRHTYPNHVERVDKYITDFTRLAHKRGMKVIDHVDMPLLWNADVGFRVMCENSTQLMRNLNDGSVNWMFCLNNPERRQIFFKWALELVKKSNIDGMMVDEITFFTENFCGCRFCREKFTADTGLVMPMDETDPALHNSNNLLWKVWLQWRNKSIGDWWVAFRKNIAQVKPDFSTLKYTTHWGFSGRPAGVLFEGARAVDILGTEIMSRNVVASYRPVNTFRKMKSGLGDFYKAPIYGLVYPGDGCWNIAYTGWALNYINRQTTWDKSQAQPEGAPDYKVYPERLDLSKVYSLADTAVVYSLPTIYYPANIRYINEVLGLSEVLSDLNVAHDFVIDEALTRPEMLKRFKTLIVANARSMSDEAINAVKKFAREGGTVYLSFNAATADEMGFDRKEWPFKDIFGLHIRTVKAPASGIATRRTDEFKAAGKEWQKMPMTGFARIFGKKQKNVQVLCSLRDRKNEVPAVFSARYGKGKIIYSAIAWGATVMETESGPLTVNRWDPPAELMQNVRNIMQSLQPAKSIIKFTQLPKEVISTVNATRLDDNREMVVVNLMNFTGARPPLGKMAGSTAKAARGKLACDVVFELRRNSSKVAEVYAVSPEFSGRRKIAFSKGADGCTKIKVSPEQLKNFLEVRVVMK